MVRVGEILHAALPVTDLERARAFYEGVLGLVPNPQRPVLSVEGVWYDIGTQQIHLIAVSERPERVQAALGQGGHIAFAVDDLEGLQ
ncbi:MAG: VOC family protein, partial [Burkholderiales bacterium]